MGDKVCRVIHHDVTDPYLNLAFEEGILDAMRVDEKIPPTIRLWRNARSVIIGRFQSVGDEVDIDACEEFSVRIARRCSGGGAVYNDMGNLNWSLYLRPEAHAVSVEVKSLFQLVASSLASNLAALGVPASSASNSVYINGGKVSGLAMYMKGGYRTLHGTLLVRSDLTILNKVLKASNNQNSRYTRSIRVPTINLSSALAEDISLDASAEILKKAILEAIGARAEAGNLTKLEEELATGKLEVKHSQPNWIFSIP